MILVEILLVAILLVLIGILVKINNPFYDFQRYAEGIHTLLFEIKQSSNFLSDRVGEIADNIEKMYSIAIDIKCGIDRLEKHKID